MDALALLCTLYGDGPATLERLREAGCASLEGLEELEPEELARILGLAPAAAERFLRESRLLFERIGGGVLEDEEPQNGEHSGGAPAPDGSVRSPAPSPTPSPTPSNGRRGRRGAGAAPSRAGSALRPDAIDGLDEELCARLRQHGIDSLESLARAQSLELSQDLELGLTRVMRWQFLARRRLQEVQSAKVLVPTPRQAPTSEAAAASLAPAGRPAAAIPSTIPPAIPPAILGALRGAPELIRMPARRATPPREAGEAGGARGVKFSHSDRPPPDRPADLSRELADRARRAGAPPTARAELGSAGPLVL
ncbi:MAG TPA: helix-hairpin-helix domain-containing protein [Planctomycetota bacterium]|nr:helix-hairpin-helix domain-containing protein [Planctomycetota bacterium]